MFISQLELWGTVGGGQLEFKVIEQARRILENGELCDHMDVPLGPEIGQCCGGRVELRLSRMSKGDKRAACGRADTEEEALPHVYVMGAGHVGRALADLFQYMPVRCILIDTRESELSLNRAHVETRLSVLPEFDIYSAPADSSFVVATHDHGLDFLLTSAALELGNAVYVGMIGSGTKRAKFLKWCKQMCNGLSSEGLICPIGASGSRDKRPCVIAANVVAEVLDKLTCVGSAVADIQSYSPQKRTTRL